MRGRYERTPALIVTNTFASASRYFSSRSRAVLKFCLRLPRSAHAPPRLLDLVEEPPWRVGAVHRRSRILSDRIRCPSRRARAVLTLRLIVSASPQPVSRMTQPESSDLRGSGRGGEGPFCCRNRLELHEFSSVRERVVPGTGEHLPRLGAVDRVPVDIEEAFCWRRGRAPARWVSARSRPDLPTWFGL